MFKKICITFILLASIIFSFNFALANDGQNMLKDVTDGARNIVGGAENAIENGAKDISNTSKNMTGDMERSANQVTGTNNNMRTNENKTTNYNATRTATTGNPTFMGMTANTWTWLIMGIAAIAIVALVWYYSMQLRSNNYSDRD